MQAWDYGGQQDPPPQHEDEDPEPSNDGEVVFPGFFLQPRVQKHRGGFPPKPLENKLCLFVWVK